MLCEMPDPSSGNFTHRKVTAPWREWREKPQPLREERLPPRNDLDSKVRDGTRSSSACPLLDYQ
jgi:hypothetical protein